MLVEYIEAAMRRTEFKALEDDQTDWGEIPGFQGVWANEPTEEACRTELRSAPEDRILLGVYRHDTPPVIDGLDLNIREVA